MVFGSNVLVMPVVVGAAAAEVKRLCAKGEGRAQIMVFMAWGVQTAFDLRYGGAA